MIRVLATHILTTPRVVLSAWEAGTGPAGAHSTIATHEAPLAGAPTAAATGRTWIGQVTTRTLPADLEALPGMSDERIEAVGRWRKGLENLAEAAIERALATRVRAFRALGEATDCRRHEGEIVLWFPTVAAAEAFEQAFGHQDVEAGAWRLEGAAS